MSLQLPKFKFKNSNVGAKYSNATVVLKSIMWQEMPFQAPFAFGHPANIPYQTWHAPNLFSFPQWPYYPQLTVPSDNGDIYQVQPTNIDKTNDATDLTTKDDGRKNNRGKKGDSMSLDILIDF